MANEFRLGYIVDHNNLPDDFPAQMHNAEFWESLGRTVATFGFLEEVFLRPYFHFLPQDHMKKMKSKKHIQIGCLSLKRLYQTHLENLLIRVELQLLKIKKSLSKI